MQHYQTIEPVHLSNSWVTIGSFDGVHLGHQVIVKNLVENAHSTGAPAVVVTFFPHPAAVLGKGSNLGYLTSADEKAELLGDLGVDLVVTMPFTQKLAALSALEFMTLLKTHLGLRQLFIGYDFALGRQREGDIHRLTEIGTQLEYQVNVQHAVQIDENLVSSSQIRRLIREGEVGKAAKMLGRLYSVNGRVVRGDGRGKSLGFPTANIDYWFKRVMPPYGVYATWAWVNNVRYPSVSSLGVRPTFVTHASAPRLESYLIDFDGDLYDQEVRLEFLYWQRPELRFNSAHELIDQMNLDKILAVEVLRNDQ